MVTKCGYLCYYQNCRWHYGCTDIHQLLSEAILTEEVTFEILGFGFFSSTTSDERGFFIDELSFYSEKRIFLEEQVILAESLFVHDVLF